MACRSQINGNDPSPLDLAEFEIKSTEFSTTIDDQIDQIVESMSTLRTKVSTDFYSDLCNKIYTTYYESLHSPLYRGKYQ